MLTGIRSGIENGVEWMGERSETRGKALTSKQRMILLLFFFEIWATKTVLLRTLVQADQQLQNHTICFGKRREIYEKLVFPTGRKI